MWVFCWPASPGVLAERDAVARAASVGYLRGVNLDRRSRFPFPVDLPGGEASPLRKILVRLVIALALITFVAMVTYIGREGYIDPEDGAVSLLDAFYYSTVSITTTGYGDIRPVSDGAPG